MAMAFNAAGAGVVWPVGAPVLPGRAPGYAAGRAGELAAVMSRLEEAGVGVGDREAILQAHGDGLKVLCDDIRQFNRIPSGGVSSTVASGVIDSLCPGATRHAGP